MNAQCILFNVTYIFQGLLALVLMLFTTALVKKENCTRCVPML